MRTKQQIIRELGEIRHDLAFQGNRAMTEWNPRKVVQRSFQSHRFLWIGGAVAVGTVIIINLMPKSTETPKNERDNSAEVVKKSTLATLVLAPLLAKAQRSLLSQGRKWLTNYVNHQFLNRQVSDDTP